MPSDSPPALARPRLGAPYEDSGDRPVGHVASIRIYFILAAHRDQRLHQALTAYARAQGITLARAARDALEAYLVLGGTAPMPGTASHVHIAETSNDEHRATRVPAKVASSPREDGGTVPGIDGLLSMGTFGKSR